MKRALIAMILILVILPTAFAQEKLPELTQSYTFEDTGYTIFFPEDWRSESTEDGVIYLTNDEYYFDFDFYVPELQAERDYPAGDVEALSTLLFYAGDDAITVDWEAVESREIDGETIYEFTYTNVDSEGNEYPSVYYTRLMEDGTFVIGFMYPAGSEETVSPEAHDLGAAMIASFAKADAAPSETVSEPAEGETPYGFEKVYFFESGDSIYFPEDWDAYLTESGALRIFSADYELEFDYYYPSDLEEQSIPADDLLAAAETVFAPYNQSVSFDPDAAEISTDKELEVVTFEYTEVNQDAGTEYPTVYAALYQADGTLVIGYVYPIYGSEPVTDEALTTALQVLNSIIRAAE